jgi:flagellar hook-basal body complex protein FliE
MKINSSDYANFGLVPNLPLKLTHPKHMEFRPEEFLNRGSRITELNKKLSANAVTHTGTFEEAMLNALDKVSAYQQFSSNLSQAAIIDPDSVDIHDITIAQAEASMSLNITRTVLSRMVQGWRDLINTR